MNGSEKFIIKLLETKLTETYIEVYGAEAWNRQTDEEKGQTLHNLFMSFLKVAASKAE